VDLAKLSDASSRADMSRFEWDNVSSIIAGDVEIILAANSRRR